MMEEESVGTYDPELGWRRYTHEGWRVGIYAKRRGLDLSFISPGAPGTRGIYSFRWGHNNLYWSGSVGTTSASEQACADFMSETLFAQWKAGVAHYTLPEQ